MFLNRYKGRNNIVGTEIARRRKAQRISQRELSDKLCLIGFDIDKNGIQRIESGQRFVTDIELIKLAEYFKCDISELFGEVLL